MADALQVFFDDRAEAEVRVRWERLTAAGVPSLATRTHRRHRPHLSLALGLAIPQKARADLRRDLALLALPDLWLYTLGTFPDGQHTLFLGAVTDTELLAVHSAVHDVLAGRVRGPAGQYLPGAWVPHCTLAQDLTVEQVAAGFAALLPLRPIRAAVSGVGITDTRTGEIDFLLTR
ncbi:2'-5' RNA ligase superfamily protein [Streptoalloteichus tenebrarius]|uniref:2'-5' RNA ligase superfamily protein n=1 Tax=Streptoalloteichus tenebrarius (strain ATCC 17920 / DSM 40477 / JCM 4838 / CBS 697.72 / NBRC 16177 / NCIMB 11028 / NRRL B-12390 / A12253. 1 / ISP 5477) TaxID=1933 RepID=A0ABT1I3F5_STRSD|nr:2'-5' RNA ligase superfamily protein [Streptoalloteichus tenebrarius]BFF01562.1 2'-5' RNA ligase family protein [Streptoalloteichus tenebrarius]